MFFHSLVAARLDLFMIRHVGRDFHAAAVSFVKLFDSNLADVKDKKHVILRDINAEERKSRLILVT